MGTRSSLSILFSTLLAALSLGACANSNLGNGDPFCGNGVLEVGEACDDGNQQSGDGCSAECIPDSATLCGNDVVDTGESCDDGNTRDGDGCSSECVSEGSCGDNTLDDGEECDDGNLEPYDGCDASCLNECGNDIREGNEECDDGNTEDNDGCSAECALEAGICGNGIFNSTEQCDDGNKTNGDGCDENCKLEGAVCGNGAVDAGEECDDGNPINFDGCSNACRTERCGDHVLQPTEQCDDGNVVSGDGCSASCSSEGPVSCGNNILEQGEQCDDGNHINNDGCSATCADESSGLCDDQFTLSCGSADTWNTNFLGSTNEMLTYSCAPGLVESGREYTYRYVAATSGTVRLALSGLTSDLDIFVVDDDGNCSQDSCKVFGENATQFSAVAGKTYYIVVDGYQGATGPYSIHLDCGVCGDGTVNSGESCDDGNTTPGDGCDASCQSEGGQCVPDLEIGCGSTDTWSTLNLGSTDLVDTYACTSFNESGREYAYRFNPLVDTTMQITLTPQAGVDLDLLLLGDDGNSLCEGGDCALYADSSIQATFPAGGEYWIVVDGYQGAQGSYSIDFSCPTDPANTCVAGNGNNGDSCADIYQGSDIWRCTTSPALNNATVSQVCRNTANGPKWISFHIDPTDCCACDGAFDVGCCTANSGSPGCP